jgi:PAS domain-containing protein
MTFAALMMTVFIGICGACGIVFTLRGRREINGPFAESSKDASVLLFLNDALIDATPTALGIIGPAADTFAKACEVLNGLFPDLATIAEHPEKLPARIVNPEQPDQSIDISRHNDTLRLEIHGKIPPAAQPIVPAHTLLDDIRGFSPQLIWQQALDGKVIWANAAYRKIETQCGKTGQPLFDDVTPEACCGTTSTRRCTLAGSEKKRFDVTTARCHGYTLHFAADATALMRADDVRRTFVTTLGKTFADLSIGLAIFNKNRQLVMFNPALLDMTKLPIGFLSAQPAIDTVLDRLREMRMVPEPKDYSSWREQFTALETAAKNGTYSENWSLPDGQTFRVVGRPHPDGAFAFLFEDITAEVSLTRRFRSDIETSQAVLDTLPDAIAVFSGAGTMVISNNAYRKLWGAPKKPALEHREVQSEFSTWQDTCVATPMWTQMRDFIQRIGTREPWSDDAMLIDGRHLRCHALPIAGGMTMVRFVIAPPMRPVIQKLMQIDPAIRINKA